MSKKLFFVSISLVGILILPTLSLGQTQTGQAQAGQMQAGQTQAPSLSQIDCSQYTNTQEKLMCTYFNTLLQLYISLVQKLQAKYKQVQNISSIPNSTYSTSFNVWLKTIGGEKSDFINSIQQTSDGGYIAVGRTSSFGFDYDAFIVKLDSSGNISWSKTIGGTNYDVAYSVQQTSDGGYIVIGDITSFETLKSNILIVKLDSSGNILWSKEIEGKDSYSVSYIKQTSDGGYIISGGISRFDTGELNVLIVKLDSSGNISWSKTIGGENDDYALSVQQTSDGGYIFGGWTQSFDARKRDAFIVKLDSSGNISWSKTIGVINYNNIKSIQQTLDGGYIALGSTSFDEAKRDAFIVKLDSSGNISWSKTIGGENDDYASFIQQTLDGGYIIGGGTQSFGAGDDDAFIVKLDSSGNILWSKTIGGTNFDTAYSIQQTSDGGYIIGGGTQSFGAGHDDVLIVKLDSLGNCGNCSFIKSVSTKINSISTTLKSVSPQILPSSIIASPSSLEVVYVFPIVNTYCPH